MKEFLLIWLWLFVSFIMLALITLFFCTILYTGFALGHGLEFVGILLTVVLFSGLLAWLEYKND